MVACSIKVGSPFLKQHGCQHFSEHATSSGIACLDVCHQPIPLDGWEAATKGGLFWVRNQSLSQRIMICAVQAALPHTHRLAA